MNEIKIKCVSGISLPLTEMVLFSSKLKKHSMLEVERIVDSIVNDGFFYFQLQFQKLMERISLLMVSADIWH